MHHFNKRILFYILLCCNVSAAPPAEVLLAAMTSFPAAAMLDQRLRSQLRGEIGSINDWSTAAAGWHQQRADVLEHHQQRCIAAVPFPLPLHAVNSMMVPGHCHGSGFNMATSSERGLVLPWVDCTPPRPCIPLTAAGRVQTPAPSASVSQPAHRVAVVRSF